MFRQQDRERLIHIEQMLEQIIGADAATLEAAIAKLKGSSADLQSAINKQEKTK
jgi:hypothetical protein